MKGLSCFIVIFLITAATGCNTGYKTALVKSRSVVSAGTTHLPLLVDLIVSDNRVTATFSCKSDLGMEYAKTQAVAAALKNANADILFEPHYLIENTGSSFNVEVSGHPARYKNFRSPLTPAPATSEPIANEPEPAPKPVTAGKGIATPHPAPAKAKESIQPKSEIPKPAAPVTETKAEPVVAPQGATQAPAETIAAQPTAPTQEKNAARNEPAEEKEQPVIAKAEDKNEQSIVFHKVLPGETINGIIEQYGITLADFKRWNDLPDGISPDMNVIVRFKSTDKKVAPPETTNAGTQKNTEQAKPGVGNIKYHVLAYGETLYHLSQVYHVTVQQIKDWNKLTSNDVPVGKNLIVGK